jgi:hypothetical protein
MKLSKEQKAYLKSIDNDKKRKKQKKVFKRQNLLDSNDVLESLRNLVIRANDDENEVVFKFIYWSESMSPYSPKKTNSTITKDMLEDITKPKLRMYSIEEILKCWSTAQLKKVNYSEFINSLER